MNTSYVLSLLLAAMSFPFVSVAQPIEWTKVASFPGRISVIYFYNHDTGFVCLGTVPGAQKAVSPIIYRTANGGNSWRQTSTPAGGAGFGINDIVLENGKHGWAGGDQACGFIWETNDGGLSWQVTSSTISGGHLANTVRKTKAGLVVSDFSSGSIELSTDNGKTFVTTYTAPMIEPVLGMDFADSLHGAAVTSYRKGNKWVYTSDGGLTWEPSNYGIESWTLRGMKGTSTFFAAPEGYSNTSNYLTEIMRSDDYGKSWKKITTLPLRVTSDIEIIRNALYVQTGIIDCDHCQFPEGKGIYRSTDSGATWRGLGGPNYWSDTRFAVTEQCGSLTIYCADQYFNLYKGIDTSMQIICIDGLLHTEIEPPIAFKMNSCSESGTKASVRTETCYTLILEKEEIVGPDATFFTLSAPANPIDISGRKETFHIGFKKNAPPGVYQASLHLTGYYDYGVRGTEAFDTLLPIKATVLTRFPELTPDRPALVFTPVTPCSAPRDTILTLRNTGCDTLTITSITDDLAPYFFMDSLALPIMLVPDAALPVRFRFVAGSIGTYQRSVTFHSEANSVGADLRITVSGKKSFAPPLLSANHNAIDFQTLTTCTPHGDSTLILKNIGCDTLRILSCRPLPEWLKVARVSYPIVLAPGTSIALGVSFAPSVPAKYYTELKFVVERSSDDYTVIVRGTLKAEPPAVLASSTSIDFSTISTCEQGRDTIVSITNIGCDTLEIISGPGNAPAEFTLQSPPLPYMIEPGNKMDIQIHYSPSGNNTRHANLEFMAERLGAKTIIPIALTGTGEEGKGILTTSPNEFSFAPTGICSKSQMMTGIIANIGCDSLVVDRLLLGGAESGFSLSNITLPQVLGPHDSLQYQVSFTPITKGYQSTTITIKAHSAHYSMQPYETATPLRATVSDGTRILTLSTTAIDFGRRSMCEVRDTTIRLVNEGCDTVTVTGVDLRGSGFYVHSSSLPISIPPGRSTELSVNAGRDTTGHTLSATASITIVSNANNSISSIELHQAFVYPKTYNLSMIPVSTEGGSGITAVFELVTDSEFDGIRTLDADLSFNTDLLQFNRAESENEITFSAGHLQIVGKPDIIARNGKVATLKFDVYLTDTDSTDLLLSHSHFNSADPSFEECYATSVVQNTPFVYSDRCGDKTIRNMLRRRVPAEVASVRPNPAHNVLITEIDSPSATSADVNIFDSFGRQQYFEQISLLAGKHLYRINIALLSSGMYTLHIGTCQAISFVKTQ